jgi:drug/metabolite transporter (DMT)-like permease
MSVPAAYSGVILIWASTPLAIQWSLVGDGFLFGVGSRMLLSAVLCLALLWGLGMRLPRHGRAVRAYLAGALGIYGGMTCVYWGSQYLPSGLVSVLFGLNPLFTGALAALWLGERSFGPDRLLGMVLGIVGLVVVFGSGVYTAEAHIGIGSPDDGWSQAVGVLAVLAATLLHSLSTVWVKRIDAGLPAIAMTGGALAIAAPLYLLTWWIADGAWPRDIPLRAGLAIVYLGIFGSVLGFILFYYVLQRVDAGRVALITLITPILALIAGQLLNGETLPWKVWGGSLLILTGLSVYQWGDRLVPARRGSGSCAPGPPCAGRSPPPRR